MSLVQIASSAGGKIKLYLDIVASSGGWNNVTHVECENLASSPCTFTLSDGSGTQLYRESYPFGETTRTALPAGVRIRLSTDGTPDFGSYSLGYSGPVT